LAPRHYSGKTRRPFKIPFGQIARIKLKLPEYEKNHLKMLSYQFETQKFSGAIRTHKYGISLFFWCVADSVGRL